MFCRKCGAQLRAGAKFCAKCGATAPETPETKRAAYVKTETGAAPGREELGGKVEANPSADLIRTIPEETPASGGDFHKWFSDAGDL